MSFPSHRTLKHGLLGSVIHDNNDDNHPWKFQASITFCKNQKSWHQTSDLIQLTPKSSIYNPPYRKLIIKDPNVISSELSAINTELEASITHSLDYLNGEFPEIYAPRNLLRQVLKEDVYIRSTQPFTNLHNANSMDINNDVLIYSGGLCMNELYLYHLETCSKHSLPCKLQKPSHKPTYKFKTPIFQIKSSSLTGITAIRNHSSVTFLKRFDNDMEYRHAGTLPFISNSPLHVSWNSIVPGLALVLLQGGYVTLWDDGSPVTCDTIHESKLQDDYELLSCEFASHPRTIVLRSKKNLSLLDLRCGSSSPKSLIKENDDILNFTMSTEMPFIMGFATNQKVSIYDLRYMEHPLLEWMHSSVDDMPFHMEFVKNSKQDFHSALTVGFRSNGVHIYTTTNSLPYQEVQPPYRFQPFYRHSYALSDVPTGSSSVVPEGHGTIPLIGYGIWNKGEEYLLNDCLGVIQMSANGAIYMQQYSCNDLNQNVMMNHHEIVESNEGLSEEELTRIIYEYEKETVLFDESYRKHILKDRKEFDLSILHEYVQTAFSNIDDEGFIHPPNRLKCLKPCIYSEYEMVYPNCNFQIPPTHKTSDLFHSSNHDHHLPNGFSKKINLDLKCLRISNSTFSVKSMLEDIWKNDNVDENEKDEEHDKTMDWVEADITLSSRIYIPKWTLHDDDNDDDDSSRSSESEDLTPLKNSTNFSEKPIKLMIKQNPLPSSRRVCRLSNSWNGVDYGDSLPPISEMHRTSRTAQQFLLNQNRNMKFNKRLKCYTEYSDSSSSGDSDYGETSDAESMIFNTRKSNNDILSGKRLLFNSDDDNDDVDQDCLDIMKPDDIDIHQNVTQSSPPPPPQPQPLTKVLKSDLPPTLSQSLPPFPSNPINSLPQSFPMGSQASQLNKKKRKAGF